MPRTSPQGTQIGRSGPDNRRSLGWLVAAPAFVVVAALAPLATLARTPERPSTPLPAPYWGRVVHAVADVGDGRTITVTAFSFLGLNTGAESWAPGRAIEPGGPVVVSDRRCEGDTCRVTSHRIDAPREAVSRSGDQTLLRADVDGCVVDLTWRVSSDTSGRPSTVPDGVVAPWFHAPSYWHAVADGTACGGSVTGATGAVA